MIYLWLLCDFGTQSAQVVTCTYIQLGDCKSCAFIFLFHILRREENSALDSTCSLLRTMPTALKPELTTQKLNWYSTVRVEVQKRDSGHSYVSPDTHLPFSYVCKVVTKLLAPSFLTLGTGKFLQHRVARSTLWPVNFDNVMKMLLSILCKVKLPSSEVVLLNNVHEMRSFVLWTHSF